MNTSPFDLQLWSYSFQAMASPCCIHLYAPNQAEGERVIECCVNEVERLEARYSRFLNESYIFEINRVALLGGEIKLDLETAALMEYAFACYRKSGGVFDITSGVLRKAWDFSGDRIPEAAEVAELLKCVGLNKISWNNPVLRFLVPGQEIDFGGIVKEYAAMRAAEICQEHGVVHGLIDLGGDIHVVGPHPNGDPWDIQIRHPRHKNKTLTTLQLHQGGVASSGDYERCIMKDGKRYGHILSPKTGQPVTGLAAVTVVANDCLVAGSLATIAMLKGADGPRWLIDMGVDHVWFNDKGDLGGNLS